MAMVVLPVLAVLAVRRMVMGVMVVLEVQAVQRAVVLEVSVETHLQLREVVYPLEVMAVMVEMQETAVLAVRLTEDSTA